MVVLKFSVAVIIAAVLLLGIWNEDKIARIERKVFARLFRKHTSDRVRYDIPNQGDEYCEKRHSDFYDIKVGPDHCA